MKVHYFFDQVTATYTYIVIDEESSKCAVIDPVLNFNLSSGQISFESINAVMAYIANHQLEVQWILETHAHADHLTGAHYLKESVGGQIGIGARIKEVQEHWVSIFNEAHKTKMDGSQFDVLLEDQDRFNIGNLSVEVLHTPGHTPTCLSYKIKNCIFVGDTILMPYVGTARADFPGGNAEVLYDSIQKILSLPDDTKIYVCHDYPLEGEKPRCMTTVADQKEHNVMVRGGISKEQFVSMRNSKDKGKPAPKLLLPSIQVNMRAGDLGEVADNNKQFIKIPLVIHDKAAKL